MSNLINDILSESSNKNIFYDILSDNDAEALLKIKTHQNTYSQKEEVIDKGSVLMTFLTEALQAKEAVEIPEILQQINSLSPYDYDLAELSRLLLALEASNTRPALEGRLVYLIYELLSHSADLVRTAHTQYIEANQEMNPQLWRTGVATRKWAQNLLEYLERHGDAQDQINLLYAKAKISTSLMGHYPRTFGPDMVQLAAKLEEIGDLEKAEQFYLSIFRKFSDILKQVETAQQEGQTIEMTVDVTIPLECMLQSVKALERIKQESLGRYVERLENILT